ncbi:MAG: T9SS type A sorting domain-containing protein [Candidatus Marinimicrobia bacterium]|nr:T9SS type A sorting domain-containing protein [Candidatus Neomarinimicrobiota bacterium]MCF7850314.1 T9SS type A sorting domain-containing protein [Candidatus Neomarinimicrobiota bacterium]MCF7903906.1 T9SS type A sorting domain-containing protein [Candidatus Neomarinimicrobiota bacterium]
MKPILQSLIVIVTAITLLPAQELIMLDTYFPDSDHGFSDRYSTFSSTMAESGNLLALYGLIAWGEVSYRVRHYPQNEPATAYSVGGYLGNSGWYDPAISGFYNQKLLVRATYYGDLIEPYTTHRLSSLDLTADNAHSEQFFYTKYSHVRGLWKTDSSHASIFSENQPVGGVGLLNFISNIELFNDHQNLHDSSFVVSGDTIVHFSGITNYSTTKMRDSNSFIAVFHVLQNDSLGFIYLNNDSVITQSNSILPDGRGRYQIHSTDGMFWVLHLPPTIGAAIKLWNFDTNTLTSTVVDIYTSPSGSNEYINGYFSSLTADELVLQIPILADQSSMDPLNWYGLINKRISLSTHSVTAIDTIFIFEDQTDIIRHRISNDGKNFHSLIGTRTPDYSRLYYYGVNNLVSIDSHKHQVPIKHVVIENYPNPFNPTTTISYDLPEYTHVTLTIYDVTGREVVTLQDVERSAGYYEVQWNGTDARGNQVSTGVYFAQLQAGAPQPDGVQFSETIKMVHLK